MSKFFPTAHLTSIPCRTLSTHHTLCKPLPFVTLTPALPSRFSLSSPLSNPHRPLFLHPLPDSYYRRNLSIRAFDSSSETQKDESSAEKEKDPADSAESGGDNGSVVKPGEEYPSGEFVFEEFGAWKKFVVKLRMLIEFPWRRVRKGSVLTMQLRGQVSDQLKSRFSSGLSLPQICENFIKAAYDPRIAGVYLHIEPLNCGWGKVEEIRRHILDFKKSGKFIVCYVPVCGEKEYYLACACEELYFPPSAYFALNGLAVQASFLGGVLENVGVEPQVERIGKYKSAGDQLIRKNMSEENCEMLTSLLDNIYGNWLDKVSHATGKERENIENFINEGVYQVEKLKEDGWITNIMYDDEVMSKLKGRLGIQEDKKLPVVDYRKYSRVRKWTLGLSGGKDKIAIIRASGSISRVRGSFSVSSSGIVAEQFIEKIRSIRDHRAITKTQQSLSVEAHINVLLSQACWDAPTLLGYEPSYKGKLRRRSKEAVPSTEGIGRGKKVTSSRGSKQPQVKLPTFRKPAEFWFGGGDQAEHPGINVPLQTLIPEHTEGMGRRNVVRVNIRDGKAIQQQPGVAEPAEKRQKLTHDFFPTKTPAPLSGQQERSESSATGGSKATQQPSGSAGLVAAQEFSPSYALAGGRVVTLEDSVKTEPQLAAALLQGLALPKDMQKILDGLQPSLIHAGAHLVQAGQALLRSSRDAELVLAERARYHDDLKVEREKVRSYKGSLKMAKTQIAELEKERDEMEEKMKAAEREVAKVLRREKRKMKEVDGKAYQASFDRAGAEYMRDARSMVNDAIRMRIPIAYRTGYKDGVKAACGVMQLEADTNFMKSIPAASTPELVLPYTDEECAPLPPEDFPDSEDEVEDLTLEDADADVGGGGVRGKDGKGTDNAAGVADPMSAADAEGGTMIVDKDAEAGANVDAFGFDTAAAEADVNAGGAAQG